MKSLKFCLLQQKMTLNKTFQESKILSLKIHISLKIFFYNKSSKQGNDGVKIY